MLTNKTAYPPVSSSPPDLESPRCAQGGDQPGVDESGSMETRGLELLLQVVQRGEQTQPALEIASNETTQPPSGRPDLAGATVTEKRLNRYSYDYGLYRTA